MKEKVGCYLPLDLATDSMFPFKTETSVKVKVSFRLGEEKLIVEKWKEVEET